MLAASAQPGLGIDSAPQKLLIRWGMDRKVIEMATNDRIILDQVLEQQRQTLAPGLDAATYFEVFTAEQVLKDYDLSYDEIESGIVAGGGDGGIDALHAFVNGELIQEDTDVTELKRNIQIEVVLLQAKTAAGFSEATMDRFAAAAEDLFDLSKPLSTLVAVYNARLLDAAENFRNAYQALAAKFPRLSVRFCYATKGDQVHPNVSRKVGRIEAAIRQHFSSADFNFTFLGARALLDLARRTPTTSYELKLAENPISATGDVAFVCLVSIKDFYRFITDSEGRVVRHIFEANVRDYQGKTQVNEQIQDTLQHPVAEDFWWLNNGVTVLATRATQSGKAITIENPEIVNGLQTSTEIHAYVSTCNTDKESRNILVRVIVPNAAESRDRIIKATNSQTAIPPASLRATDRIHRDIEQYLKPFGLYYDRRKNYYKNEGKPISRIVSIQQMAQAVMAIALRRPDTARARPSSLLKQDADYHSLFNTQYPIELYRACGEVMKQTEGFLSQHVDAPSAADKNNLKFYTAMAASQEALAHSEPTVAQLAGLVGRLIAAAQLEAAYQLVKQEYQARGATDQVAKGKELLADVKRRLTSKFPT